jgi:alpha-D-xyloside xylohydrolase
MKAAGEKDIITLCRSAWAGSQRYGACVWSGDIPSTFEYLRKQIPAGLNAAMSGIVWWNTDIGGFSGANVHDPEFHELLVRWFQYAVFTPVFRLHGDRQPKHNTGKGPKHPPNEIWSYGEEVYGILKEQLLLRERLRPYIMQHMKLAHERGTPVMRPLFYDFPGDPHCWEVEDQFMFGPDILVSPVAHKGARNHIVYLPDGAAWRDAWSDEPLEGGQEIAAEAPLHRIPLFLREGARIAIRG